MEKIAEVIKENKLKTGIIIGILLIVIGMGISMCFYLDYQNKQYEVEEVTSFSYYLLYENKKMGVIDTNGNILIQPIYEDIKIPNPQKAVFVCKSEEKTVVLNDKNETLFSEFEEVSAINTKGIASNMPYEKRVLRYKQNGKYGLIDYDGEIITKPIYEEIQGLENKESELLVKKDGKFGVINQKGARIIKPQYDGIVADGYYDENQKYALSGYIVSTKTEEGYRYGYINSKREKVLDLKYNSIERILNLKDTENVYLMAVRNGQAGVVKNEEVIVNYAYQSVEYDDYNNLFILQRTSNFGVADINGKEIIPLEYKEINIKGIYIQAKGPEDAITYFDETGNKIVDVKYESVLKTEKENYFITINSEGKYGLIDNSKNVLLENTYRYLEYLYEDYFIASNEEGYLGIINNKGKNVVEFKYDVLQKVDNTNMIQAKIIKENTTDIYSTKLELIYTNKNVAIYSYKDHIEVITEEETKYFDLYGNEINEANVQTTTKEPEQIGAYHKVYYGYGESYYTKEIEE